MSNTYAQLSLGGNNNQDTVRQLQQLLNEKMGAGLQVDGIFGPKTEKAVRDYQTANRLQVDGIVGPKTWGALLSTQNSGAAEEKPQALSPAEEVKKELDSVMANAPGDFQFSQQSLWEAALKAYQEQTPFTYDPNMDPMYRHYRQELMTQGQKAMEDAMGIIQARTGGYGNSYAQTAGQQAYGEQLQQMNEILPQLYELAYKKYEGETDRLRENFQVLEDSRVQEQEEYLAEKKRHDAQVDDLRSQYLDALQSQDDRFATMVTLLRLGYQPTDEELASVGMTSSLAQLLRNS